MVKAISTVPTSKSIPKVGKSASNGIVKPGMKAIPSVCPLLLLVVIYILNFVMRLLIDFPMNSKRTNAMKGSRQGSILSVQDIAVQSQALINVKDSVKVHMEIA